MVAPPHAYVLVTAARNEERFVGRTIESVAAQTLLPRRWAIVSDGSTDGTDAIVARYAERLEFLHLMRVDAAGERNFGSKARAINAGYNDLAGVEHEFVGILDADVVLDPNYYRQVLAKFDADETLGLAGGVVADHVNGTFVPKRPSLQWSVNGPIQVFRRACFEAIGGYRPMPYGGVDAVAEVMARMHGWRVQSFPEIRARHLRRTGTEAQGKLRANYKLGVQHYKLGYHPLFMLARCLYRLLDPPYLLGSLMMLCGYSWPALRREERQVDPAFVRFLRREQLNRLCPWPHTVAVQEPKQPRSSRT